MHMSETDQAIHGAVDAVKPWTIKAIATEARDAAIAQARTENLTVGQWLERRIREWTGDAARAAPGSTTISMAELTNAMNAAAATSNSSGVPLPKRTAGHAFTLLTNRLREARGMPALQPRKTTPGKAKTLELDGPDEATPELIERVRRAAAEA
jgi:hypothetical protein